MHNSGYKRIYIFLKEEDRGFDSGVKPSGHVKIEIRGGEGKLDAFFSDLKQNDETIYKLYLVKLLAERAVAAEVGVLEADKGSLVKKTSFNTDNYFGAGIGAGEIDMAVVCASVNQGGTRAFPMIGFKDKGQPWRKQTDIAISDIFCSKEKKTVAAAGPIEIRAAYEKEKAIEPIETINMKQENTDVNVTSTRPYAKNADDVNVTSQPDANVTPNRCVNSEPNVDANVIPSRCVNAEPNVDANVIPNRCVNTETNVDEDNANNVNVTSTRPYAKNADDVNVTSQPDVNVTSQPDAKKGQRSVSYESDNENPDSVIESDIAKLEEMYDKTFERIEPFSRGRSDYNWWKADNPYRLNDCLYTANIKAPLIFNRDVMASHSKYKFILSGIYTDAKEGTKLLVFGIPGAYNIDPRPYRNMCRWVQAENGIGRAGVFGYWLIYLDPYSNKILLLE